jgi:hypothetical protein
MAALPTVEEKDARGPNRERAVAAEIVIGDHSLGKSHC